MFTEAFLAVVHMYNLPMEYDRTLVQHGRGHCQGTLRRQPRKLALRPQLGTSRHLSAEGGSQHRASNAECWICHISSASEVALLIAIFVE